MGGTLRLAALLCCSLLAGQDTGLAGSPAGRGTAWYDGFEGFVEGYEAAKQGGKGMVVYFYADWCGYCRQLERELLYTQEVDSWTAANLIKVRINPEAGDNERAVAQRYRVNGYPALFVHPEDLSAALPIDRLEADPTANRGFRLKTPREFIDTLRRAAAPTARGS